MGGEQGYKGFGLAVLLDILASGLSGGLCPPAGPPNKMTNNVLLVAWNPETFAGMLHFTGEADKLIRSVRDARPKPGVDQVRLPGDRCRQTFSQRQRGGIELDAGTSSALVALARALRVALPSWLGAPDE
jgi:LDH2 family malate/lactate/ureidoglycolate dehydrogenase